MQKVHFDFLPPANEVAERLCFQSCLSISQLFCQQGDRVPCDHGPNCRGTPPPCSQKLAPHCSETPSAPALHPRHVAPCSVLEPHCTWNPLALFCPTNMFNLVYCQTCTVGKRAVCILLECFLVASIPILFRTYLTDIQDFQGSLQQEYLQPRSGISSTAFLLICFYHQEFMLL